jgi:hypothetical protein
LGVVFVQATHEKIFLKNKNSPSGRGVVMKNYNFFLGGQDGEMIAIREILERNDIAFEDKKIGWGAKASAYAEKIEAAVAAGFIPVLVELEIDITVPHGAIVVDHHNERAGEPASILQVLALLGIEPTRHDFLVAANDTGFLHGLLRFGATSEEILDIRLGDRGSQGITPEQEAQAEESFRKMGVEECDNIVLGIVDNIPHSRFAPISDRAFASGHVDCLFCVHRAEDGSHEIQFEWYPALVLALATRYPDSWSGVQYWGSTSADPDEAIAFIRDWLICNGKLEEVSQPSPRRK